MLQLLLALGLAWVTLRLHDEVTRRPDPADRGGGRPRVGSIRDVTGTALLKESEALDWQRARALEPVHDNDRLQTKGGSISLIDMRGEQLRIDPNSLVVFRLPRLDEEAEVEVEKGTLDAQIGEANVNLRAGSSQVRSRPRSIEFLGEQGGLPARSPELVSAAVRHAENLIRVARELGAPAESLTPARVLAAEAHAFVETGDLDHAMTWAEQAYALALGPYRAARRSRKAIVSITRGEDGVQRVQVLQGEVVVVSPVKSVTVKEGEGVKLGTGGTPGQKRRLLDAPAVAFPAADQTVWNQHQFAFAWKPLDGAARYAVEIAQDAQFTRIVHVGESAEPRWTPPEALADGTYYWRVRGVDRESFVGMFATQAFKIGTDRVPPALDLTGKGAWEEPSR